MDRVPIAPHTPWLAPLAGYSDLPFRLLCREYGASVACTEMVSAKGLVYSSPGTNELLHSTPKDKPLVVQLFGNEVSFMEKALALLLEQGFCFFDLNMGCAVPKVTRTGCGAAMLKDIENTLAVARSMINLAGEGRVGFKMRLGWDETSPVWQDLPLRLQDLGAGWITLHPRTAKQSFSGTAHWPALAQLVSIIHIPLIASGDLFCAADGIRCIQETGVASVMYARGALHNPAIFDEHKAQLTNPSTFIADDNAQKKQLLTMVRRHMALAQEYSTPKVALLKMRTFVPRYIHRIPGARALRQSLVQCRTWEELDNILEDFFMHTP